MTLDRSTEDRPALWKDPYVWAALIVMLAVRAVALTRAPDIDELFTLWITSRSFGGLMETLKLDSGPPVWYLILEPFSRLGPLIAARTMAMLAGVALFIVAVLAAPDRFTRRLVAALVALHPLSVFFNTRGRAYSLVALLVVIAAVALSRWAETRERRMVVAASIALLVGAYTHYYVIYLFPLPFVIGLTRDRALAKQGLLASLATGVAFLPGFLLIRVQPESATSWMRIDDDLLRVLHTAGSFARLGFDGRQRFSSELATMVLHLAGPLILLAAMIGARRSSTAVRQLLVVLTAIGAAVAAAALGFNAYFPLRFESILVGPVVLFFALSAREMSPRAGRILAGIAVVTALAGTAALIVPQREAWSPERHAALAIRTNVPADVPIFTSGPVFFELRAQRDDEWMPELHVFPAAREVHPGHLGTPEMIAADLPRLRNLKRRFVWIGPTGSPEAEALRKNMGASIVAEEYGLTTLLVDP